MNRNAAPGLKIGSLRGVPVFIGGSWVLIAIVIVGAIVVRASCG
mgnify:CR=1 FL=1